MRELGIFKGHTLKAARAAGLAGPGRLSRWHAPASAPCSLAEKMPSQVKGGWISRQLELSTYWRLGEAHASNRLVSFVKCMLAVMNLLLWRYGSAGFMCWFKLIGLS